MERKLHPVADQNERIVGRVGDGSPPGQPIGPGRADDFWFRKFHVDCKCRRLSHRGIRVNVGSRAFDLLVLLLTSRGKVVGKQDIVDYVWPTTIVDESNLRYQVASLRRALEDDGDLIKNIPGRGYLFADEIESDCEPTTQPEFDQPIARATHLEVAAKGQKGLPRVAIVDDDRNTRDALHGLLASAGLQVESFGSVREFSDAPRHSPPECLILDVWMPGRNGLDFQAELAKEGCAPPVIFISGHADVQMCVQAMKAGAVEFFTKPVRHQALLEAIELAFTSGKHRGDHRFG